MSGRKVIGIVGSRRRDSLADFQAVEKAFRHIYEPGDQIVSGGCPQGGDRFAELIAISLAKLGHISHEHLFTLSLNARHHMIKEYGAPFTLHHAHWDKLGKSAGHQRNTLIARDADKLIACVAVDRTGGTEDTIRKFCEKMKMPEFACIHKELLYLV